MSFAAVTIAARTQEVSCRSPVALIEGKYEILAKIKEGGMGTVYKVRHRLLDEVRVVKVMRQQIGADAELSRRFTQEAKTATRLKHPNIGAILDFALDSDGMAARHATRRR